MIYDIKEIPDHLRHYFTDAPQLGQEATPQEFVATLVRVFAGVWRVLRDDGVLFVNLGDSYANKSRCLIPERFVLAMQEAGWFVRDVIVWHKPAPMPVSVRDRCTPAWEPIFQFTKSARYFWDQEAVKVASPTAGKPILTAGGWDTGEGSHGAFHRNGREKGQYTGAVQAATANPRNVWQTPLDTLSRFELESLIRELAGDDATDVWRISTEPLKAKHYAAFPSELPTRCIKAATSERGVCAKCLAPWVRVVERKASTAGGDRGTDGTSNARGGDRALHNGSAWYENKNTTATVAWKPSCQCNAETIPATVLDPFSGAGTTCLAAARLGRHGIGLELNPEYVKLSIERIEQGLAKHAQHTAKTVVRSAPMARSGETFLYPEFATPE